MYAKKKKSKQQQQKTKNKLRTKKGWKKKSGLNGIRTHDLCNAGTVPRLDKRILVRS